MLFLGVEDTADVQQWKAKRQKNEESNEGLWSSVLLLSVLCLRFEKGAECRFPSFKPRRKFDVIRDQLGKLPGVEDDY